MSYKLALKSDKKVKGRSNLNKTKYSKNSKKHFLVCTVECQEVTLSFVLLHLHLTVKDNSAVATWSPRPRPDPSWAHERGTTQTPETIQVLIWATSWLGTTTMTTWRSFTITTIVLWMTLHRLKSHQPLQQRHVLDRWTPAFQWLQTTIKPTAVRLKTFPIFYPGRFSLPFPPSLNKKTLTRGLWEVTKPLLEEFHGRWRETFIRFMTFFSVCCFFLLFGWELSYTFILASRSSRWQWCNSI